MAVLKARVARRDTKTSIIFEFSLRRRGRVGSWITDITKFSQLSKMATSDKIRSVRATPDARRSGSDESDAKSSYVAWRTSLIK